MKAVKMQGVLNVECAEGFELCEDLVVFEDEAVTHISPQSLNALVAWGGTCDKRSTIYA